MTTTETAASTADRELVLSRLIAAPAASLYRAWTEPALLKEWFAPLPLDDLARRARCAAGRR